MSNIPNSLSEICLTLFRLAMCLADPWPFSWKNRRGCWGIWLVCSSWCFDLFKGSLGWVGLVKVTVFLGFWLFLGFPASMRRLRGFSVKHRVTTLFRCMFRRHRCSGYYQRLDQPGRYQGRIIRSVVSWTRRLRTKAKAICSRAQFSGYFLAEKEPAAVPKGHLAVYVGGGEKGEDFTRVLVPVIYFNHPLFGELLREAEEKFGFNHPGGITLPCRISEFERVQTRIIRECCGSTRMIPRRQWRPGLRWNVWWWWRRLRENLN